MGEAVKKVLFVDDQADSWVDRFNRYLGEYGFVFVHETVAEQTAVRIAEEKPDVVLLDVMFPGQGLMLEPKGKMILEEIRQRYPALPVVVFTSTLADENHTLDEAELSGAHFIFSKDRFLADDESDPYAELAEKLEAAIDAVRHAVPLDERLGFVVGDTERMRALAAKIMQVAGTETTVLVTGESGTGKELVARAIHRLSLRARAPFVAVNCGGLTEETLQSQLFGHERGAFTGAVRAHRGFFEQAQGGTLFLDEVDAMPAALQDKLLRVLQERKIQRMGAEAEVPVDARIIAATNKDIEGYVGRGVFRQDLYFRLKVVDIVVPPLRERLGDLPALYADLVAKLNGKLGKRIATAIRADVLQKLRSHDWRGNVRELENVLEHAMVVARSNVLTPSVINIGGATTTSGTPESDWAARILGGRTEWSALKDLRGAARQQVLRSVIEGWTEHRGAPPTSAELAGLLGTSTDNMRRVLSAAGIRLREHRRMHKDR